MPTRGYPAELGIAASPALVRDQLHARTARDKPRSEWAARCGEWRSQWENHWSLCEKSEGKPLRPERVVAELRRAVPPGGIVLEAIAESAR